MHRLTALILVALLAGAATASGQDYQATETLDETDVASWDPNDSVTVTVNPSSPGTPVTVTVTGAIPPPAVRNADQLTVGIQNEDAAARTELLFLHDGSMVFGSIDVFGGNGGTVLTVDGTSGAEVTAQGVVKLAGYNASGIRSAAIAVTNGGVLNVGDGAADLTGEQGLRVAEGTITISGSGKLNTSTFILGTDEGIAGGSVMTISTGGEFHVTNERFAAQIDVGTLNIRNDAGTVEFLGGVTVGGDGIVNIDTAAGPATAVTLGTNKSLKLGMFAQLNITGNGTAVITDGAGGGYLWNDFGVVSVGSNATLQVDRFYQTRGETVINGTLDANRVGGGAFEVAGGLATVAGRLLADSALVSGGTMDINGTIEANTFSVSGGEANVTATGTTQALTNEATGTGKLNINGTVASDVKLSTRGGGVLNFNQGASVGAGSGSVALDIGGTANSAFNLREDLTTGGTNTFALGGGNLNLLNNKKLTVDSTGSTLSLYGNLNFDGGTVEFNDGVIFRSGGIFNKRSAEAVMTMNGAALEIGRGATLDASLGSVNITGASGLAINGGTYMAGWENNAVTMAKVTAPSGTGTLSVAGNSKIIMTNRLQAQAQSITGGGTPLLILASECLDGTVTTMSYGDDFYIYDFATATDGSGQWGLYMTGFREASEDEKIASILGGWNGHPRVAGHASKVINNDFLGAIIAGRRLQVSLSYDSLTPDGQFNANVLGSLSSPATSDYDALMLYNGSGLAMANQAVLAANSHTMNRLGLRNTWLRREMAATDDGAFGCGVPLACEFLDENVANRVWASAQYLYDRQYWDEGFEGYEYRARGVMVGYDRIFGDLAVGAAFSYVGGDFQDAAALSHNSTLDTYGFHLYGIYNHESGAFITGTIGTSYTDNQIEDLRVLNGAPGWNSADYRGQGWQVAASVGYDWKFDDCLTVTPSIGVAHQDYRSKAHQQVFIAADGSAAAGTLQAGRVKNHSTTMPLRLSATYDIAGDDESLFTVNADLGYAYEFNSKGAEGRVGYAGLGGMVAPVSIASRAPGRHLFSVGLGGKYLYKQYEFGLNYEYTWRNQHRSHLLLGSFGLNF